jgi:hypothetical protein
MDTSGPEYLLAETYLLLFPEAKKTPPGEGREQGNLSVNVSLCASADGS